jgi:hypothetical protein
MNRVKLIQLLLLIPFINFAQLKVDKAVIKKYEHAFNKLNPSDKQAIKQHQEKETELGISLITLNEIDTLNKEEIIQGNNFYLIENLDSKAGNGLSKELNASLYTPVITIAILQNDTLLLSIDGLFVEGIMHKIYSRNVSTYYNEYYKNDSILRLHLNEPKVSALTVPTKTKVFVISSIDFKPGEIIYGEVELETDPYYKDTFGFKNNYIKKRLRYNYLFKIRVPKNST